MNDTDKINNELDEALGDVSVLLAEPTVAPDTLHMQLVCIVGHLRRIKVLNNPEPGPCPECGARRQFNTEAEIVHARAGSVECPPVPFSEGPVQALLGVLRKI